MWNVPTWGAGPSMALYYPAVQYAGQEHPQVAQMVSSEALKFPHEQLQTHCFLACFFELR